MQSVRKDGASQMGMPERPMPAQLHGPGQRQPTSQPREGEAMKTEIVVPHIHPSEIKNKLYAAYMSAKASDDQFTRNGAILCDPGWNVCAGFNHFIEGFGHLPEHHERPLKYSLTEHAERDVIYKAAKLGYSTEGLTLVANWIACPDCARAIVLAGIECVVTHKQCMDRTPARWKERVDQGLEIIRSKCRLIIWDGKVGCTNFNNGELWSP